MEFVYVDSGFNSLRVGWDRSSGRIGIIALNRPLKSNAFDGGMWSEFPKVTCWLRHHKRYIVPNGSRPKQLFIAYPGLLSCSFHNQFPCCAQAVRVLGNKDSVRVVSHHVASAGIHIGLHSEMFVLMHVHHARISFLLPLVLASHNLPLFVAAFTLPATACAPDSPR